MPIDPIISWLLAKFPAQAITYLLAVASTIYILNKRISSLEKNHILLDVNFKKFVANLEAFKSEAERDMRDLAARISGVRDKQDESNQLLWKIAGKLEVDIS